MSAAHSAEKKKSQIARAEVIFLFFPILDCWYVYLLEIPFIYPSVFALEDIATWPPFPAALGRSSLKLIKESSEVNYCESSCIELCFEQ